MAIFEEVVAWATTPGNRLVKYRCFKNLSNNLFAVQSSDYFDRSERPQRVSESELQAIELFLEESPETRCTWHNSLLDAIKHHNEEFDA